MSAGSRDDVPDDGRGMSVGSATFATGAMSVSESMSPPSATENVGGTLGTSKLGPADPLALHVVDVERERVVPDVGVSRELKRIVGISGGCRCG
jgi:hypothetical protein